MKVALGAGPAGGSCRESWSTSYFATTLLYYVGTQTSQLGHDDFEVKFLTMKFI